MENIFFQKKRPVIRYTGGKMENILFQKKNRSFMNTIMTLSFQTEKFRRKKKFTFVGTLDRVHGVARMWRTVLWPSTAAFVDRRTDVGELGRERAMLPTERRIGCHNMTVLVSIFLQQKRNFLHEKTMRWCHFFPSIQSSFIIPV